MLLGGVREGRVEDREEGMGGGVEQRKGWVERGRGWGERGTGGGEGGKGGIERGRGGGRGRVKWGDRGECKQNIWL